MLKKKKLILLFEKLLKERNELTDSFLQVQYIQILKSLFKKLHIQKTFCNHCFCNQFKKKLLKKIWYQLCSGCNKKFSVRFL